jgi:hypothetical protein
MTRKPKPFEVAMAEMGHVQAGTDGCTHPPTRLSAWHARDDSAPEGIVFCVCCNACGAVLAGARTNGDTNAGRLPT